MNNVAGIRLVLAATSLFAAASVRAQQLTATGAGATGRMTEVVEIKDAWDDGPATFGSLEPRAVLTRVETKLGISERVKVHLLLFGPWGAQHFAFDESLVDPAATEGRGIRTLMKPVDLDGDDRNEILLIEAEVRTVLPLEENGDPVAGAVPLLDNLHVTLRYLSRDDESLLERPLPADPKEPRFAAVLAIDFGGPVNAALQHAAADHAFAAGDYEQARYRWRLVREWAESQMTGQELNRLSIESGLAEPQALDPVALWQVAVLRHETLPAWYRQRDPP